MLWCFKWAVARCAAHLGLYKEGTRETAQILGLSRLPVLSLAQTQAVDQSLDVFVCYRVSRAGRAGGKVQC